MGATSILKMKRYSKKEASEVAKDFFSENKQSFDRCIEDLYLHICSFNTPTRYATRSYWKLLPNGYRSFVAGELGEFTKIPKHRIEEIFHELEKIIKLYLTYRIIGNENEEPDQGVKDLIRCIEQGDTISREEVEFLRIHDDLKLLIKVTD